MVLLLTLLPFYWNKYTDFVEAFHEEVFRPHTDLFVEISSGSNEAIIIWHRNWANKTKIKWPALWFVRWASLCSNFCSVNTLNQRQLMLRFLLIVMAVRPYTASRENMSEIIYICASITLSICLNFIQDAWYEPQLMCYITQHRMNAAKWTTMEALLHATERCKWLVNPVYMNSTKSESNYSHSLKNVSIWSVQKVKILFHRRGAEDGFSLAIMPRKYSFPWPLLYNKFLANSFLSIKHEFLSGGMLGLCWRE